MAWALALALIASVACDHGAHGAGPVGSPTGPTPGVTETAGTGPPPVAHLVLILLENEEYSSMLGAKEAPYLNALADRSVLLTRYYGVGHPSLPNYLALAAGSTFGIESDCTSCHVAGPDLVDQLERNGVSWKAYMEGMPTPCYTGAGTDDYAKKHDPFVYFDDVRNDPERCGKVVPFGELAADIAGHRLPAFAWITPDLCHDGHDCPVSATDRWLRHWVPRITGALGTDGAVILAYDEGTSEAGCCGHAAGGHVLAVIAGPAARSGVRIATRLDHYSVLRLVEDNWGLGRLGQAACPCTPSITGWRA